MLVFTIVTTFTTMCILTVKHAAYPHISYVFASGKKSVKQIKLYKVVRMISSLK